MKYKENKTLIHFTPQLVKNTDQHLAMTQWKEMNSVYIFLH